MVHWAAKRVQSLRFKLVVGLAVVLTVTLSLFFYLQYTRHRDQLLSQMITMTTRQSELIESSLRHSMITRDPDELASIFHHVGQQEGLLDIMLLDRVGRIAASANPQEVGTQLDITTPSCQLCHWGRAAREEARTVVFATENGTKVFRNVNPVENGPQCQPCHLSESAINGVLVADFSMADIEKQTAAERREMLTILVAAVAVVILATSLVTSQLVLARLRIVVDAVRRAGSGDLDQTLGFRGHDEIDELAHAFDRMAADLKDKARLEAEAAESARLATERERRLRVLSALNAVAGTVSRSIELQQILEDALAEAVDVLNMDGGRVYLVAGTNELAVKAHYGAAEEFAEEEPRLRVGECLCGQAFQTGELLLVESVADYPRPVQQHCSRAGYRSVACIPLMSKDKVLGVLNLGSRQQRSFAADDARLLEAIGHQIGVAIENAQLYREVKAFSHQLEGRVARRTEELARARDELEEKARQLQQILTEMIHIQEEERGRIARDMHDGLIQIIIGALYEIQAAKENLPTRPEGAVEKLSTAQELLTRMEAETRRVIYDLRPMILDARGLTPALKRHAQSFARLFGIPCSVHVTGSPFRLPSDKEVSTYRIVQEALQNVQAHSEATSVRLHLAFRPTALLVTVEDDGRGFNYDDVLNKPAGRLGLIGMRERAQSIGAKISVESVVGQGTIVTLRVPRE